jgi:hypothetical protein
VPQPILPGGQIIQLFPAGSPLVRAERISEPEQNNMQRGVPGRIQSIVNIHNPTIEVHVVDPGINTGAAVILAPGGGHNTLNVGSEGADFVPFFYNYGVNTIILRNRLRRDGYNPQTDEVYDAQQAIRMVRARAREWNIDPNKIGIVGFSAGAELAAPAALMFEAYDKANGAAGDPLAGISSRPDFVGLVYPGPTPFTRDPATAIPKNTPPAFITCAGRDDAVQRDLGRSVFCGDAQGTHPERRDAYLRQWRPRQRPEGSRWRAVRDVAAALHRLVSRPGLSGQARRRNEGRSRRRDARLGSAEIAPATDGLGRVPLRSAPSARRVSRDGCDRPSSHAPA